MAQYRFIHLRTVLRFTGIVTLILAFLMLIPAIYAFLEGEKVMSAFIFSALSSAAIGLTLYLAGNKNIEGLNKRDGFVTIILIWIIVTVCGSLPFVMSGSTANFGDAVFESIAGFSTNGLSLLNFSSTPYSILLWRGIIEWVGGIGIIIFIMSFIPYFKTGQAQVFFYDRSDETIGNMKTTVIGTARRLISIYAGFTIVLFLTLLIQKMQLKEALLYTFSTMSGSGFSPQNGNVSHLSPAILTTIAVFMFVAGSNLYLLYYALRLHFKKIVRNDEFKWYLLSIVIPLILLLVEYGFINGFFGEAYFVGETLFNIISIITTTGFYVAQEIPFQRDFWWLIFFLLMFLGSASASSGGGINVFRQAVLLRSARRYFLSILHPKAIYRVRFNKVDLEENNVGRVMGFLLIFLLVYVLGVLMLTLSGYGFQDSLAMSISFLSNTGNAVRLLISDLNMADIHWYDKFIFVALMLFGRLHIIPLILVMSPIFWKK